MIILLSPAKDLSAAPFPKTKETSTPSLLEHSRTLVAKLRTLSAKRLGALMDISPKLAALNHQRYLDWSTPFTTKNARPAVFTFNGEVYHGLGPRTFDADDLRFAQRHLRILSGLYGVLRPLDLMQDYRLMMGTKFPVGRAKDLYAFWGDRISEELKKDSVSTGSKVVVNLASSEYFKAVRPKVLGARVITPVFKMKQGNAYKVVMVLAKHQRGAMARHIIQHRLMDVEALKIYKEDGYRYSPEDSTADEWVFLQTDPNFTIRGRRAAVR